MTRTLFGSPPLESAMTFQSERFGSSMRLDVDGHHRGRALDVLRQELGAHGVGGEEDGDVLCT